MTNKPTNRESLRIKYSELSDKYKTLAINLREALRKFLNDAGIDVLDVQYRVKEFESFYEKIERKSYSKPFEEMEDICGLRIICSYLSDLDKISELINSEFDVLESTDKSDLLEPDRFGYRSLHFVVSIKKEWLKAPNYRGLSDLKAEIQVRTILMHAWADVEHKLAYKKKDHVPPQLRRKLSQLSALFEVADQQLDSLREEKGKYIESIVISGKKPRIIQFDASQGLNIDNLQAVLDLYFPNRKRSTDGAAHLLDDLHTNDVTIEDIEDGYAKVKDILEESEMGLEELVKQKGVLWGQEYRMSQVGIIRFILELTHDAYWSSREHDIPRFVAEHIRKWRAVLSKRQS
jgi:ppGpp synthetase/RelA/SpoT-type nucleotidyltranferase